MEIAPCQWDFNIANCPIRAYFHSIVDTMEIAPYCLFSNANIPLRRGYFHSNIDTYNGID